MLLAAPSPADRQGVTLGVTGDAFSLSKAKLAVSVAFPELGARTEKLSSWPMVFAKGHPQASGFQSPSYLEVARSLVLHLGEPFFFIIIIIVVVVWVPSLEPHSPVLRAYSCFAVRNHKGILAGLGDYVKILGILGIWGMSLPCAITLPTVL